MEWVATSEGCDGDVAAGSFAEAARVEEFFEFDGVRACGEGGVSCCASCSLLDSSSALLEFSHTRNPRAPLGALGS